MEREEAVTIVDALAPQVTWRALRSCRDVTRWLEAAAAVPVHTTLLQLECVPGEEAIIAAVTFVGIRRRLLAERRGVVAGDLEPATFRPSLEADPEDRVGLADGCLRLMAAEVAGRPLDDLARQLHEAHGLSAVLALAAVAKALGALLVEPFDGYLTYGDLYCAETAWMSRTAARLL
ncbi:MAG: hypothetical protein QOF53_3827 [Nocardioidaceae bacterium]|nr:hypothetical protein [Nocardioidaceae bacterium]